MRLTVLKGVYEPAEDTYLLLKWAQRLIKPGQRVLEICAGTGYVGLHLLKRGARVDFSDAYSKSVRNIRLNLRRNGLRARVFRAYLFPRVFKRYDWIIANPPYIRGHRADDPSIFCGPRCEIVREIVRRFRRFGRRLLLIKSSESSIPIPGRLMDSIIIGGEKIEVFLLGHAFKSNHRNTNEGEYGKVRDRKGIGR